MELFRRLLRYGGCGRVFRELRREIRAFLFEDDFDIFKCLFKKYLDVLFRGNFLISRLGGLEK